MYIYILYTYHVFKPPNRRIEVMRELSVLHEDLGDISVCIYPAYGDICVYI